MNYNKLREIRKKEKLSQEELANELGFNHQSISQYETGSNVNIPLNYIEWIYDKGYDLNTLFDDNEKECVLREVVVLNVIGDLKKHKEIDFPGFTKKIGDYSKEEQKDLYLDIFLNDENKLMFAAEPEAKYHVEKDREIFKLKGQIELLKEIIYTLKAEGFVEQKKVATK